MQTQWRTTSCNYFTDCSLLQRQHIIKELENPLVPEVSNDEDGHKQRAEGHSIANCIHDIEPLEEVLL